MKKSEDAVRLFAICFLLFRDALRLAIPDNSTIGNYTLPVVFPGFLPNWPQPSLPEVGLAAAVPFVSTHDSYNVQTGVTCITILSQCPLSAHMTPTLGRIPRDQSGSVAVPFVSTHDSYFEGVVIEVVFYAGMS